MTGVESVCVLANRNLLEWQVKALEKLRAETDVEIPLVVVNETTDIDHPGFSRGASPLGEEAYENASGLSLSDVKLFYHVLQQEGAWAFVLAERKFAWMLGLDEPGLMKRRPLNDVSALSDAGRVGCRPTPVDGAWCDLPPDVVDRIAAETDVVVRFGFNLLTGRILSEPEYGVLSFHPGDIRHYRGLSPARMFLNGERTAGATLQQLTDELDGGNVVVIESVDITDAHTLDEIQNRITGLQVDMLTEGIKRLRDPEFTPTPPDSRAPYVSVKKRQSLRFAGKVLAKNVLGRARTVVEGTGE